MTEHFDENHEVESENVDALEKFDAETIALIRKILEKAKEASDPALLEKAKAALKRILEESEV